MDDATVVERKEMFRSMLADAVRVLCRNTMPYNTELSIEGLIGITADKKDIVLVSINELIGNKGDKTDQSSSSNFSIKSKSRKRKKFKKVVHSDYEAEMPMVKVSKIDDDANLVCQLSKELADFDVESFVKKEIPEVNADYAFRPDMYVTSTPLTTTTTSPGKFQLSDALPQFTESNQGRDFLASNMAATDSSMPLLSTQPYTELLHECVDENGTTVYQCSLCKKTIKSKGNFGRHIKSHVNSSVLHPCDICGKAFGRKDNLRRHIHLVHQMGSSSNANANTPSQNNCNMDNNTDNDNVIDNLQSLAESIPDALVNNEQTHNEGKTEPPPAMVLCQTDMPPQPQVYMDNPAVFP